ncbi:hypothetical protein [Lactococcus formosensis]|jgi:hypothetical protein|uniref:Uncharacterized protein n=1 Tax=Lactococcus formosensis TaxID=1281486 RepID=A0A9Q8Y2N6_9LACT|nr:hypothetical protein [Lactococcus formosensis]USJ20389.1 hypothetical protein LMK00_11415 [Lactococcus formosensis]
MIKIIDPKEEQKHLLQEDLIFTASQVNLKWEMEQFMQKFSFPNDQVHQDFKILLVSTIPKGEFKKALEKIAELKLVFTENKALLSDLSQLENTIRLGGLK